MTIRRKHRLRPTRAIVAGVVAVSFLAGVAIVRAGEQKKAPVTVSKSPAFQPARPYWLELTIAQRSALAPLTDDWEHLDAQTKRKWVEIANRYPRMKPEEQERTRDRMREWARLTPEQRRVARDSYARIHAMSPEERAEMLRKYQELSPEAREKLTHQGQTAKPLVVPRPQAATPSAQRSQLREGAKVPSPAVAAQKNVRPAVAPTPPKPAEAAPLESPPPATAPTAPAS